MVALTQPLLAVNVAFDIVFGIFVVALVVLAVITLRWAFRHDRAGYAAWRQRQQAASTSTSTSTPTPTPTSTTPTPPHPGEGGAPPPPDP